MQAIRFHTIGSPEVLKLEEVEKPGRGQAKRWSESMWRVSTLPTRCFDEAATRANRSFRKRRGLRLPELWKRSARESAGLSLAGG